MGARLPGLALPGHANETIQHHIQRRHWVRRPHLYELRVGASWEDLVPLKERPNYRQVHIIYLQMPHCLQT